MSSDTTERHPFEHHPSGEELSALVDGELDEARGNEIRSHVSACDACRSTRQRLGEVRHLVGRLDDAPADGASAEAVARALRAVSERAAAQRRYRLLVGVAACTLVVAGVVGGVFLANEPSSTKSAAAQKAVHAGPGAIAGALSPSSRSTTVELRLLETGDRPGQVVGQLTRGLVESLRVSSGPKGTFDVRVVEGLLNGPAESISGSTRVGAFWAGQLIGLVRTESSGAIEITGLSRANALELRRVFG